MPSSSLTGEAGGELGKSLGCAVWPCKPDISPGWESRALLLLSAWPLRADGANASSEHSSVEVLSWGNAAKFHPRALHVASSPACHLRTVRNGCW